MAVNLNKAADSFFSVLDNFFRDELCDKVYEYAVARGRPWGYILFPSLLHSFQEPMS
jgi:hypothetical protein